MEQYYIDFIGSKIYNLITKKKDFRQEQHCSHTLRFFQPLKILPSFRAKCISYTVQSIQQITSFNLLLQQHYSYLQLKKMKNLGLFSAPRVLHVFQLQIHFSFCRFLCCCFIIVLAKASYCTCIISIVVHSGTCCDTKLIIQKFSYHQKISNNKI